MGLFWKGIWVSKLYSFTIIYDIKKLIGLCWVLSLLEELWVMIISLAGMYERLRVPEVSAEQCFNHSIAEA
jgi:hypothetical protein